MLAKLFIDAGWWTVPLKGKLERLANDKKTLPIFEPSWKDKYSTTFNTTPTPLAGVITGVKSGIMAIDCDNKLTYDLFKSLDPNYSFDFISKGKAAGGGTIIYKYSNEVGTFKLADKDDNPYSLKMDFYSDEGMVYLPTEDNHTKESWAHVTALPELKECPATVIGMLKALKAKVIEPTAIKQQVKHTISNRLAPLLDNLVENDKYDPTVFKILTPYSFRDLPSYTSKGHLHPNDVPDGRGSEYLSKVSAILGSDISVNVELYTKTMLFINSLWARPMDKSKLMLTIINPMVEQKAMIDGHIIWQYDPHWEKMGFIATAINGDYLESFYDDIKGIYYLINYTVPYIRTFKEKSKVLTTLKALLGRTLTESHYDNIKQIVRTSLKPEMEFGHLEGTDRFNLFKQTPELAVLTNPTPYKDSYKRPETIIKYFETLIPDKFMRDFVLSFIKTKFTTFNYSPIVLYMIGKPGSGKDTLVNIIRRITGEDYVAKPDTKVFLETHNGWLMDKYVVQLDEYGNKLTRFTDKQEVLGRLKSYTGAPEFQVRAMATDGFNYRHSTTFILTANSNPLPVEMDDRRFVFIKTPNPLQIQRWVIEDGGIAVVQERIKVEIMDFCYYLATEIASLSGDEFVIAPMTKDKEDLMLETLGTADMLIYRLGKNDFEAVKELALEYGVIGFTDGWENNKLWEEKIEELFNLMTEGKGNFKSFTKAAKNAMIPRHHTTRNGINSFYYYFNDLYRYADGEANDGFVGYDEPVTEIKGLS